MAATYTKPTKIPRWADTGTKLEPAEGKKDEGWTYEEVPPYNWENWKSNLIGEWFKWLNERLFDGTTKDDLIINHPGKPEKAIEIKVAEIVLYDPTSSDRIAKFQENQHFFFGSDEMSIARSASVDEYHIYMHWDATSKYPVLAFNKAAWKFSIYLNNTGGSSRPDVDDNGNFEIDHNGVAKIRNITGDAGAEINFINVTRSGSTKYWKFYQYNDRIYFASYTAADAKECDYFYLDGTNKYMVFDQNIKLIPDTTNKGSFGNTDRYWEKLFVNYVYESKYAYTYNKGSEDKNITAGSTVSITPDTEIRNSTGTFVASNQLTCAVKGKYLINAVFIAEFSDESMVDCELRLYKNGTEETNSRITFDATGADYLPASPRVHIPYMAVIDVTTPATDYFEIKAYQNNASQTLSIKAGSLFSATLLNAEA